MGYHATKIADGVHAIDENGFVQCYLIEGEAIAVLLDSCAGGGDDFRDAVYGLTGKPIRLVITHSDHDHTGGQEYFDTPLMHPAEYARYHAHDGVGQHTRPGKQGDAGKTGRDAHDGGGNVAEPDPGAASAKPAGHAHDGGGRAVEPLWEGQIIDLGGVKLETVLIPGHTPGSIALLDRGGRRLYVGDTISDTHVFMFGDGRDLRAFVASLKKLEGLAPHIDTIHSAHGSLALGPEWITKTRVAAEKLLSGELSAQAPPRDLPCRQYSHDGVNLLY
ncbi:MAG: MBL fold metallo-hydrolase [Lachnospiraceae bacterium]|jgi:glyoxylase-like metal-dependent hydrolase (beta-lactamase superfamily II)|nr:MBL fold metallo-hydrolase [Lachnospiraceae bacterium]